jgi:hypothetical protein
MSLRALPKERRRDRIPWSRMASGTTQRSLLPSQVSSRRIGQYRNRRGRRFSSGISTLPVPQGRCLHAISQARADRSVDRGQSAQPRKIGVSPPPIFLSNSDFAREVTCVHEGVVAGESLGRGPQIGTDRAAVRPVPKLPQPAGVGGRSVRRPRQAYKPYPRCSQRARATKQSLLHQFYAALRECRKLLRSLNIL